MSADADPPPYVPMKVIDPREWAGKPIPERQWIVDEWMPAEGEVTGNWGGGGDGKTILAMQLQVACSTGTPWIGLQVRPCCTFGIYCEDNADELHRRFNDASAGAGMGFLELGDMRCVSAVGEDNALVRFGFDGSVQMTPRFNDLVAEAKRIEAELLVVDTAADTFGNGNENDRGHVRAFIGNVLRSAAIELNGAVLLNAHPSKSGIKDGTLDGGSTGWSNSVRSRWALHRPPAEEGAEVDVNARLLTRMKANYASIGDQIPLRWEGGLLVPEKPPVGLTPIEALNRMLVVERVFLAILDRTAKSNINLSMGNTSNNYAPRYMAKQPDRQGVVKVEFEKAMHNLLHNGVILNEQYGRPADMRARLARNPEKAVENGGDDGDIL